VGTHIPPPGHAFSASHVTATHCWMVGSHSNPCPHKSGQGSGDSAHSNCRQGVVEHCLSMETHIPPPGHAFSASHVTATHCSVSGSHSNPCPHKFGHGSGSPHSNCRQGVVKHCLSMGAHIPPPGHAFSASHVTGTH
jgi:hypothetical protein